MVVHYAGLFVPMDLRLVPMAVLYAVAVSSTSIAMLVLHGQTFAELMF